eukprot:480490_1
MSHKDKCFKNRTQWNQQQSPIKQYDLPLQTTKSIKDKVIQIKIDASDSFKKDSKWNERIDFNGISVIRFLCDNGQIIRGDILTQKQGEIFVHFDQASCHYGKKYDWVVVPNKQICYPPNKKPPHVPLPIKSPIKQYDLPLQTTKSIKDKVIQIKIDASDSFKKDSKWNERTDFNGISMIGFLCDN